MSDRRPDDPESAGRQEEMARAAAEDPSLFLRTTTQFYRAEMDRVATWRTRLDQTTNWAVVVMAAVLTWAFSSPDNPHYVILIGCLAVAAFLFIEAQRYQEYDAWRSRVRLIQRDLLADVYEPAGRTRSDWRSRLGEDLRRPTIDLPLWKAVGHRLEHVYFALMTVMIAAWALRVTVFEADVPWYETASIARVPGTAVVAGIAVGYLLIATLTLWSVRESWRVEFEEDDADGSTGEG